MVLIPRGGAPAVWITDIKVAAKTLPWIPEDRVREPYAPALSSARLKVRLQTALGRDLSLPELCQAFDAVFLGLGLNASTTFGQAAGVTDALTFLRDAKQNLLPALPARVAVLGAGNTAMDAASTALDRGARDVTVIYRRSFREMPAWKAERDGFLDKGGNILLLHQPVGYQADAAGRMQGIRLVRTELGEPDTSGRRRPSPLPNSEFTFPADLVIEAMGQSVVRGSALRHVEGVAFSPEGLIAVDGRFATSVPRLFAAGDAVNGGTTAVQGVAEAMRAADAIHADLMARQD